MSTLSSGLYGFKGISQGLFLTGLIISIVMLSALINSGQAIATPDLEQEPDPEPEPSFANKIVWPDNRQVAVSLSYDDALNSQLDNAIPALNQYGFTASFYLTLASDAVPGRIEQWRQAVKQGHELGNHSIFHGCSKEPEDRDWVAEHLDLSKRSVADVVAEIRVASDYLYAIDGKSTRTFTAPCFETKVAGEQSFLDDIRGDFIGIKGHERNLSKADNRLWAAFAITGQALIDYVEEQAKEASVIQIVFHGIGGDHLSVDIDAHQALLRYLDANKDKYWVADYRSIMAVVNEQRAPR
ncbi:polysaccharide deacetylase family protein [Thalassotalea sp. PS06]|uniref:polysaccharide deacetylase family protein n=1 Tax=Thalassotalea sp. PS06 TaxID=2594005 RepID=UPI0011651E6A|nr:polysaccharide deacetylase family protein [Thalassotalea sp. PS06]QDP01105.1 polysaccharide deacetylase family protein [Thalassotalea sp. PS06]